MRLTVCMTSGAPSRPRRSSRSVVGRQARVLRIRIGAEIKRLREDAGLSIRQLAAAAGIDDGYLGQVERGVREPSLTVLVAIATALGGDAHVRLYPGTGPRLRDSIQARIVEAILRAADPRWTKRVEVAVYRPVRGVIDLVLEDPTTSPPVFVAVEVHSELRRLEQQLRWAGEKAESLPSADFWVAQPIKLDIYRVLVLRQTQANRVLADRFAETIAAAYPTSPTEALRALTEPHIRWPGSAFLWALVEGDAVRLKDRLGRGL